MFGNDSAIFEFRGPWGVPVQIGGSFIFLVLFYVSFTSGPTVLAYDLAFLGLLVLSIFLHELGHPWGSLIQGLRVKRIMLHGAGGFCERSLSASRYQQELIVAMGPIVTLAIWAGSSLLSMWIDPDLTNTSDLVWALDTLAWINLYLAIFNLMPVQPLDGGKLLELVLSRVLRFEWATKLSGLIGMVMILAWLPLMIVGYMGFGMMLMFVPAIGINWMMAKQSVRGVPLRHTFGR